MDDPLESVMYITSVGVPSVIYETVKNLRQAPLVVFPPCPPPGQPTFECLPPSCRRPFWRAGAAEEQSKKLAMIFKRETPISSP